MNEKNEENVFNILYELADTVIEIKEVSPEDLHIKAVFNCSNEFVESFFKQINEKLNICENEQEKIFVKEVALNFLMASLKKILVYCDCPDENIELIADNIKDNILKCTRSNYNKRK